MGLTRPRADLLEDCVHCGFCLPACPTYRLWSAEADSPRGRLVLMAAPRQQERLDPSVVRHIDACLGCMACVPACPSGVRYDELLEDMRERVEERGARGTADRAWRALLLAVLPRPGRLAWARRALFAYQRTGLRRLVESMGLLALLPRRVRALARLQPSVTPRRALPDRLLPSGEARATVALHLGCVQRVFFSDVNAAAARVLVADGCRVVVDEDAGCCGALGLHAGAGEWARRTGAELARALSRQPFDYLVTTAAGCGSSLKDYSRILPDEQGAALTGERIAAATRDVTEMLAELGARAPRNELRGRVAFHDACHLAHAQGVTDAPRALLAGVPGLDVTEPREVDMCCGSAGVYNLVEPETGDVLGERKARAVLETGAEMLVTTNPGCALQIASHLERLGRSLPVRHVVQVVDASIRGVSFEALARDAGS